MKAPQQSLKTGATKNGEQKVVKNLALLVNDICQRLQSRILVLLSMLQRPKPSGQEKPPENNS